VTRYAKNRTVNLTGVGNEIKKNRYDAATYYYGDDE